MIKIMFGLAFGVIVLILGLLWVIKKFIGFWEAGAYDEKVKR